MNVAPKAPFWLRGNDQLLRDLDAQSSGLAAAEAGKRRAQYGPNIAVVPTRRSVLAKILRKLADPLPLILLIAAAISGATGDWRSFIIISLIVAFSVTLDIVQEHKAQLAIDALKRSVAVTATVRRDQHTIELPVQELVPGDVVELRSGDLVPADGIVLNSRGALVNEAVLTGEPYPAGKRPDLPPSAEVTDACNALFSGTTLIAGEATMLVVETGGRTRFGRIASSLQQNTPATAFERGVHGLGMLILRLTGFLVLFVLLTQLIGHGLSLESFLFAVALAVGLTPELLPMVMTVTLARGAIRMAERKVVVKRLSAIHDLGAIDILCTDKTGTLTEGKVAHVGSLGIDGKENPHTTTLACLNSVFASGRRNNLDDALMQADDSESRHWSRIDDLPFDFDRRRSSVLLSQREQRLMITKGAPEPLLALCTAVEDGNGVVRALNEQTRRNIESLLKQKGQQGLRLLGVAYRELPSDRNRIQLVDEANLILTGWAMFVDPPKPSVIAAIERLGRSGVRIKVISGDAGPVVEHLAQILGLPARGVMSGDEIADLTDAALAVRAGEVDLFVRITPEQKSRIVRILRQRGHAVGFLGDGINDAPAIHAADVGISVDSGTEVARQAADIILLAPDLAVLADGVFEGRRTYANIMKYIRMGTSSNFGNMLSMAVASLALPFLPLAPLQILLNNLIYDISEVGIPFDEADADDLNHPKTWDIMNVLRFTLIMGPLSSVFDITTFGLLRGAFDAGIAEFQTAWFIESIATQILVIFLIRTSRYFWRSRPNTILALTSIGALVAALVVALTPVGGIFGFTALPLPIIVAIACVSTSYLVCAEIVKRFALNPVKGGFERDQKTSFMRA